MRNNGERFYVFRIIWRSFQSHTDLRLSLPTSPHVAWDGKNLQCLQASSSKGHTGPTSGDPEVSHLEPGLQPFLHPPDMLQDQVSAHPQGSLISALWGDCGFFSFRPAFPTESLGIFL